MPIYYGSGAEMVFVGRIANSDILYDFHFPDTAGYMREYLQESEENYFERAVTVTEQEFTDWKKAGRTIDAFGEYCLLCEQTSEYLLRRERCIFHSAAISFKGHAWLIAGGSGVGKSTLCRFLADSMPDDIEIINGDKPALQYDAEQGFIVWPSPWNGKENWHGAEAAPLAGVFLLRRDSETKLLKAEPRDAAARVFINIFQSFTDEAVIRSAGSIAEKILKTVPVWNLKENLVSEAAEIMLQKMQEVHGSEL